jgi:hypothetical protein
MIVTSGLLLATALASAAPEQPAAPGGGFSGLWTRWSGVNAESLQAETARAAPAPSEGAYRPGSPELGARVGEEVRGGNCIEGERLARAAGDFPLLEAVRAHCRSGAVQAVSRR